MKRKILISMMITFTICFCAAAGDYYTQLTNGTFETGALTPWVQVSGDCWQINSDTPGREGTYCARSDSGGEANMGVLRSQAFMCPSNWVVCIGLGGWSSWADHGGDYNYITLNLTNGTELARKYVPDPHTADPYAGWNTIIPVQISSELAFDQMCYIEAVDDSDGSGYAWLAIDDARIVANTDEAKMDFELVEGTWDPGFWTESGNAFPDFPTAKNRRGGAITLINNSMYADSYQDSGESGTGELKSQNFVHPNGKIEFVIGGWTTNSPSGNTTLPNYVGLYLASDNSELARVDAPNQNGGHPTNIYSVSHYGDSVYLKVVDTNNESDGGGWAWMTADHFSFNVIPEPTTFGLLAIFGLAFLRKK